MAIEYSTKLLQLGSSPDLFETLYVKSRTLHKETSSLCNVMGGQSNKCLNLTDKCHFDR